MSESDFEFEDEAQDQAARNPVRARMRELEDRNKALEKPKQPHVSWRLLKQELILIQQQPNISLKATTVS